jgi:hypothetical protein
MLAMLSKGENFTVDQHFATLNPIYKVNSYDIEHFLVDEIRKMNEMTSDSRLRGNDLSVSCRCR